MKKISSVLILCLVCCLVYGQLPNINLKDVKGNNVNISKIDNDGKPMIISFWATWCKPCKNELDAISYLYEDWQENYDVELVAITIDTRRNMAQVGPMVESKGWEYTILSAVQSDMENAFNFNFIPQTLLIDKKGNIVYTHSSYNPGDEDELEKYLEKYAAQ